MATYIYETIPKNEDDKIKRYEIQQSMKDSALTKHPETGETIRRVIVGGYGVLSSGKGNTDVASPSAGACCSGHGCGCH